MGKIYDCEQGSDEWRMCRLGKVTGSRVCDVVRRTKTGISASRQTLLGELVAERLSGVPADSFQSKAMAWGKETEDEARRAYAMMHGVTPRQVGFVDHDRLAMAGASPDSLIGEDGGFEVKCPNSATHIATLLGAPIDPDYVKQMQWGMACTGRAWWDFASYDPRLAPEMQLHVRRVQRDPMMIADLEIEVRKFLRDVDETIAQLRAKFATSEAA